MSGENIDGISRALMAVYEKHVKPDCIPKAFKTFPLLPKLNDAESLYRIVYICQQCGKDVGRAFLNILRVCGDCRKGVK